MAVNPMLVGGIGVGVTAVAVTGGLYAGGVIGGSSETKSTSNGTGLQKAVLATGDYLFENAEFKKQDGLYKDKWGKTYGRYLVDSNKNTKWWGESYEKFKQDHKTTPKTDKFKTVDSVNALKTMCDAAYKANKTTEIDTANNDNTGNKYKEAEIWKYCSPLGQIPVTINGNTQESYTADKIGGDTEKVNKLVSVDDPKNTVFWEIRNEEFFAESGTFSAKNEDSTPGGKFFKDFWDAKKNQGQTIKDKCKEAYSSPKTATAPAETNPTTEKVVKYCSFEGQ